MIPHVSDGQGVGLRDFQELQRALGAPVTEGRNVRARDAWNSIAVAAGLPTTDQLLVERDGPGIEVLPHWLWNRAVDIANSRNHQPPPH